MQVGTTLVALGEPVAPCRRPASQPHLSPVRLGDLAGPSGIFGVVRGATALRQSMADMLRSARSEVIRLVRPPVMDLRAEEQFRAGRAGTAVSRRVVLDRDAAGDREALDAIRNAAAGPGEVRVHPRVPMSLLAVDRKMAVIPLDRQDDTVCLLIGESAMLDSALMLFDYVWDTAVPFEFAGQSPEDHGPAGADPVGRDPGSPICLGAGVVVALTDADRQLLTLLLSGLTDETIAMHLKVSVRTVERRTRALMDTARVRTRVQLAWTAARQNWL